MFRREGGTPRAAAVLGNNSIGWTHLKICLDTKHFRTVDSANEF